MSRPSPRAGRRARDLNGSLRCSTAQPPAGATTPVPPRDRPARRVRARELLHVQSREQPRPYISRSPAQGLPPLVLGPLATRARIPVSHERPLAPRQPLRRGGRRQLRRAQGPRLPRAPPGGRPAVSPVGAADRPQPLRRRPAPANAALRALRRHRGERRGGRSAVVGGGARPGADRSGNRIRFSPHARCRRRRAARRPRATSRACWALSMRPTP